MYSANLLLLAISLMFVIIGIVLTVRDFKQGDDDDDY